MITITLIIIGLLFLFCMAFIYNSVYLVNQSEAIIVERFGRFHKILTPGLHVVTPFMDIPRTVYWTYIMPSPDLKKYHRYNTSFYRIDMREAVYDFPKQNVITKDNVTMEINALLYYQITDPKAAVYEVVNLPEAIEKLTQTTLRNVIGSMDLDESLVSRDAINARLRLILDEATDKWGVKVNRVELQEVNPPHDIQIAMEKQMRAERDRRAKILQAEGDKGAAILEAEGQKLAQILRAQGEAESKIIAADGEAQAMERIKQAAGNKELMSYLIATNYLKVLPTMMEGKNDKLVVIPYEASAFTGALSSIKTILNEVK